MPNSTVMTLAAIFRSRLLQMAVAREKKFIYLYNWVEVASKIEHAVCYYKVYTFNGIISQLF